MSNFADLRKISVNERTEKKDGLTYLSWAWAWDIFKQHCPDATYRVEKNHNGLPYFESSAGAMVYTTVTVNDISHEMWLPVMDGKNKAMKAEPYTYMVRDFKTKQQVEKTVEAFTMFDVNKTLMRCLVKNLAMFGLAIYIYAGEDLPDVEPEPIDLEPLILAMHEAKTEDDLKTAYVAAIRIVQGNQDAMKTLEACKDTCKIALKGATFSKPEVQS
jgi:hypothetical protein